MSEVFRRRRRAEEETAPAVREDSPAPARTTGPWDAADDYPEAERVDLGGLRLPVDPRFEIQLRVDGDQITGVIVLLEGSLLQVQAVAAPKRNGVWDEMRADAVRDVTAAGGALEERDGPFGPELVGRAPAQGQTEPQPVRFLGVDGPRWFLQAVISGPAAAGGEAGDVLEDVVRGIVVVRGDEPMPPREVIPLRLPAERQPADEQAPGREELRPFERGPEINEIR
ncbi:DUF3710 domain-containing protein [Microbispora sp. NBC_01389]|uniref:DUF3710 domain-containing protein n=1 Tax=Microbispora sp. NBC_01389 TaxID=2903584 RepID=UPI0032477F11